MPINEISPLILQKKLLTTSKQERLQKSTFFWSMSQF